MDTAHLASMIAAMTDLTPIREESASDRWRWLPPPRRWAPLLKLLARYEDPAMPYLPRPRLKFSKYEGDYGQLSRFKEWSAITGADE